MDNHEKQHIRETLLELVSKVGETNAHIMNIKNDISENSRAQKAMWKVIDEQNAKLRKLEDAHLVRETKSGVIALVVSVAAWVLGQFFKR